MNNKIAVLFSGGSDSTLAAAIAAERFRQVYLVTFQHPFMLRHDKININISALRRKYPDCNFIYHKEKINSLYKRLYFGKYVSYIKKYGSMVIPWICGACKLSMHLKTIAFCGSNNICHVFCGAHEESAHIFPAQMPKIIERTQKIYQNYGIAYETPVYRKDRTDKILFDMGIIQNPNVKQQHLIYSTQHTCLLGVLLHAHSQIYYKPLFGLPQYQRNAYRFFSSKIEDIDMDTLLQGMENNGNSRPEQS
ncbi:MAG: 7-cyano-7-deazaguanine synthase [candidate division Zixibacteria bacterium]